MKALLATLTLAFACGGSTASSPSPTTGPAATAPQVSPEHQDMIAKMDLFLRDPAAGDPKAFMSFINQSDAVLVIFNQRLLPQNPAAPEGTDAILLAAFAAGNARAQLSKGVKADSPVEGVRGMLAVYAFLKAKNPAVASKSLDELAAREAAGSLDAAIAERLSSK